MCVGVSCSRCFRVFVCVDQLAQLLERSASLTCLPDLRARVRCTRTGDECSRILVALALLQPTGARACYLALASRLLQSIDTLSAHQLCDVRTLRMLRVAEAAMCGGGAWRVAPDGEWEQ